MSICPKNKSSKGRRDKRRANWKMSAMNLVKCSKCGALMMPHRVCKSCGSYNKKEIIALDTAMSAFLSCTGLSPSLAGFPKTILLELQNQLCGPNPRVHALWFGLFPFRSPLLWKSSFLSFPRPT